MRKNKLKDANLPPRQLEILRMLAEGYKGMQIKSILGMSAPCYHVHCYQIRQKTGIKDHKSMEACMEYLVTYKRHLVTPTPQQQKVLALLRDGKKYREIADTLGISVGTVMNHASMGRFRLGVESQQVIRQQLVNAAMDAEPASKNVDDY